MKRSGITERVIKALWGSAAHTCSFRDARDGTVCDERLYLDNKTIKGIKGTIVGDVAHIAGWSKGGPRFNANLSSEQRNAEPNLILLCKKHHRVVDENPEVFTATALTAMKGAHLAWVRNMIEHGRLAPRSPRLVARLRLDDDGRPETWRGHYHLDLWGADLPVDTLKVRYRLHHTYQQQKRDGDCRPFFALRKLWSYGDFVVRTEIGRASGKTLVLRTLLSAALKDGFVASKHPAIDRAYEAAIEDIIHN